MQHDGAHGIGRCEAAGNKSDQPRLTEVKATISPGKSPMLVQDPDHLASCLLDRASDIFWLAQI